MLHIISIAAKITSIANDCRPGQPETFKWRGLRRHCCVQYTRAVIDHATAWQIPGTGFADTTEEDMREIMQPPPVTAVDILEEENVAEEDRNDSGEENVGGDAGSGDAGRRGGLSIANIKEIIDLGVRLRHLIEQDVSANSEAKSSAIMKLMEDYHQQYNAHVNRLQQR